jgi:putative ATP-dependent endonuclease of the OLD family
MPDRRPGERAWIYASIDDCNSIKKGAPHSYRQQTINFQLGVTHQCQLKGVHKLMKLSSVSIKTYRTIDAIDLSFPVSYSALCGPNDSGKTNVIRAIRAMMKDDDDGPYYQDEGISVKDDYPKWLDTPIDQRSVSISLQVEVHPEKDAGLYQFLLRQLQIEATATDLRLRMDATYSSDKQAPKVSVSCGATTFEGLEAQEVFKKFQTSRSILFHNSPQSELIRLRYREGFGQLRELSGDGAAALAKLKKDMDKGLQRIAKNQQQELEGLLGRLETKYRVGLSVSAFDLGWLPFNLTLGDSKHDVPLDNWGSGTQNRTLILRTLFRAKQISEAETSASKITPLIIIEEPESFLHPYAQAEFGRVLQDLAEEFQVQVLVTTHSPYLLSLSHPESNILLSRKAHYGQLRETQRVDSSGENWMAPFGQALGMSSDEFKPWQRLFGSQSDAILLVEGDTDKAYFEMLRDPEHGENALKFDGDIIAYDGTGTLKNNMLLRFIKNRYKRVFLTFDLDMKSEVERCLASLDMKKDSDYLAIGIDAPGKRAIEGLLPETVRTAVFAAAPDLVMAATSGTKEERDQARNQLKRMYLEQFRAVARPGSEYFAEFYRIAKAATKALRAQ